ncbi:MAG: hypothetical protein QM765_53385 [Myxococcales bacterium]
MKLDRRFSFSPAASSLHDAASVDRILSGLADALAKAGGVRAVPEDAPLDQPLLHVILTGGTERLVLERLRTRASKSHREPVILVAHPAHNSLAASLEILARVRADGGSGRIVLVEGDPAGDVERLRETAHLSHVGISLRRARLGAVGEPSEWLVASSHNAATVKKSWGPEVVSIALRDFHERVAAAQADAALSKDLLSGAGKSEVPEAEVLKASGVYRVLEALVAEHRLWALTVRCFDLVTQQRTTGCLALSKLADDGIPAGCEGDVPAAVALLWMHLLTGDAAWMANPASISPQRGEMVLAHCTVPRTMVRAYDVRTHFESDLGVAVAGELGPGPVTLVRIGGEQLEQIWLAEGELVKAPRQERLCRTQALVKVDPAALEQVLERPLGNHLVMIPGRKAKLLQASRELILE